MACHAAAEDVEDDDGLFLAAAQENDTLVANLLMCLSRSETCIPWRHLREPTPPPSSPPMAREGILPFLPQGPKWVVLRPRSRCITMEGILAKSREEGRRPSPTTPLSWSGGGSATSGSVCEDAPSRPPRRRKQRSPHEDEKTRHPQEAAVCHDLAAVASPPAKWMKVETVYQDGESHRVFLPGVSAAVGSSSGSGSSKGVVAAGTGVGEPPRPAGHVEPLRLRLPGGGTNPAVVRRPGKKKTLPELKALSESLLQERVELHKELEQRKKVYERLLEENVRLKNLELDLASHTVGEASATPVVPETTKFGEPHRHTQSCSEPSTEANRPEQLQCASASTSAPRCAFLLDLNLPPSDDL